MKYRWEGDFSKVTTYPFSQILYSLFVDNVILLLMNLFIAYRGRIDDPDIGGNAPDEMLPSLRERRATVTCEFWKRGGLADGVSMGAAKGGIEKCERLPGAGGGGEAQETIVHGISSEKKKMDKEFTMVIFVPMRSVFLSVRVRVLFIGTQCSNLYTSVD